uniref:Uncharacterized protein n=1 Tax=Proboscia inermis TaxID=420281 RepID=A0A7S0C3E8_9STRA|mmetsp:Transcript_24523/g.24962  ORF Transcript_24523/g.24962 Transcript_24523/m.24962 type:complete len:126 (+) Transcript_24523:105-482(+)
MHKQQLIRSIFLVIFLISCFDVSHSFTLISRSNGASAFRVSGSTEIHARENKASTSTDESAPKKSLEAKMKEWESTQDEIKEKSLGGLYVGRKTNDLENGIVTAFSIIIGASLVFAAFSFIIRHN